MLKTIFKFLVLIWLVVEVGRWSYNVMFVDDDTESYKMIPKLEDLFDFMHGIPYLGIPDFSRYSVQVRVRRWFILQGMGWANAVALGIIALMAVTFKKRFFGRFVTFIGKFTIGLVYLVMALVHWGPMMYKW